MINCIAVDKILDRSGKTIGYILQDMNQNTISMLTPDIKKNIINKQLNISNLKLSSDGKLIINKNWRPNKEINFISGIYGNWELDAYDSTNMFDIRHLGNKDLYFSFEYYPKDKDTLIISQTHAGRLSLNTYSNKYSYVMHKGSEQDLMRFLSEVEKLIPIRLKNIQQLKDADMTKIDRKTREDMRELERLENYQRELDNIEKYKEDYAHGGSPDTEKAYHTLEYLAQMKNWFNTNKYRLHRYNGKN